MQPMEQVLTKLGGQSECKSVNGLIDAIQQAKDAFKKRTVLPAPELRQKLLNSFGLAFESGKPKLTFIALEGLQGILRDSTLNSDKGTTSTADTLSAQMLRCLEPVHKWNPQNQSQIFTLMVQLISSNEFQISMNDVFAAMQICSKTYSTSDDPGVKLAVRAALTQMLNSFCLNRQIKAENGRQEELAVLMDLTILLNEITPRLGYSTPEKSSVDELQLALDSLYSIVSVLPAYFHRHSPLLNLFKDDLIPSLVCLLQMCDDDAQPQVAKPKTKFPSMKQFTLRGMDSVGGGKFCGRPTIFATPEVSRSFYQVIEQVIQLFNSRTEESKLILELFRSALLVSPTTNRFEALKYIKRCFSTQARAFSFLKNIAEEPLFWLISLECMEECSKCSNLELCVEAVRTLNIALEAIHSFIISTDSNIKREIAERLLDVSDSNENDDTIRILKDVKGTSGKSKTAVTFVERFQASFMEWAKMSNEKDIDAAIQQFSIDLVEELFNIASSEMLPMRRNSLESIHEGNNDFENQRRVNAEVINPTAVYLTVYASMDLCSRSRRSQLLDNFEEWYTDITHSGASVIDICMIDRSWLLEIFELLIDQDACLDGVDIGGALARIIESYGENSTDRRFSERVNDGGDIACFNSKVERWLKNHLASCWSSVLVILTRFSLKSSKKSLLLSSIIIAGVSSGLTNSTTLATGGGSAHEKLLVDGSKATLECMHSLLLLMSKFSMDKEMIWIYEKLGEEVCQLEGLRQLTEAYTSAASKFKKPWLLLSRNDAFAIGIMIDNAIRSDTMPSGAWKYVIRCIEYTSELERYLFQTRKQATYDAGGSAVGTEDSCDFLIYQHNELSGPEVSKVLDELLLKIDSFFENAPKHLNLVSICALLTTLISINEDNLKYSGDASTTAFSRITSCVILQRISQIVCGVGERRLIFLIKVWCCVKEHLTETAFAKFPDDVTKMTICCIHDCVKALMQPESCAAVQCRSFNFNHALLAIFQNILCSDVSKVETQQHIVSVIGSFMDECAERIGTGWRPLFGALKATQVSNKQVRSSSDDDGSLSSNGEKSNKIRFASVNSAVLDVFKKFLAIKNARVIYFALLDYNYCLVNFVRSAEVILDPNDPLKTAEQIEAESALEQAISSTVFGLLHKSQSMMLETFVDDGDLGSLLSLNSHLLSRLRLREKTVEFVDSAFGDERLADIDDLASSLSERPLLGLFPVQLNDYGKLAYKPETFPWLSFSDTQKCLCELLLSLVEDLCGLLPNSTSQYSHSNVVTYLSGLLHVFRTSKMRTSELGIFCLSSQLLPTLQNWVRKSPRGFMPLHRLSIQTRNLKQSTGVFTQCVVDYINDSFGADARWCEKLLTDALNLLNEYIVSSSQFVSGIGCSCLKHLLLAAGPRFTPKMWSLASLNLWRSMWESSTSKKLYAFFTDSTEFCGDIGGMTVSMRRNDSDTSVKNQFDNNDYVELQIMMKQVFLVTQDDDQKHPVINDDNENSKNSGVDEESSTRQCEYIFVFSDRDKSKPSLSIGLDEMVISLLNHQTLIQIVSQLLSGENDLLLESGTFCGGCSNALKPNNGGANARDGLLYLGDTTCHTTIATLIFSLLASAKVAEQFDERPSLKFLLQKLCHLPEVTNLYKVHASCTGLHLWTLFQMWLRMGDDEGSLKAAIDAAFADIFAGLEKAECNAAKHKLAAFAREKVCEPVRFVLAEVDLPKGDEDSGQDVEKCGKCYKVVLKDQYLKNLQRQNQADTLPKTNNQGLIAAFDSAGGSTTNGRQSPSSSTRRVNPFLCQKLSDEEKSGDVMEHNGLSLAQFSNLDMCILTHSEILATFLERLLAALDADKFRSTLPLVFPHVRRYLLTTGNRRARCVAVAFLERVERHVILLSQ